MLVQYDGKIPNNRLMKAEYAIDVQDTFWFL